MPGAPPPRTSDHIALITQTNLRRDVQDMKCADGENGLPLGQRSTLRIPRPSLMADLTQF